MLAAALPFATIGTAVLQISISARDIQFPLKMPDIRLQANSRPPIVGQSLLAGGVHIRFVRTHLLHGRTKRCVYSQPAANRTRSAVRNMAAATCGTEALPNDSTTVMVTTVTTQAKYDLDAIGDSRQMAVAVTSALIPYASAKMDSHIDPKAGG